MRGRPTDQRKDETLGFRLSTKDYQRLKKIAEDRQLRVSQLLRLTVAELLSQKKDTR